MAIPAAIAVANDAPTRTVNALVASAATTPNLKTKFAIMAMRMVYHAVPGSSPSELVICATESVMASISVNPEITPTV